MAFSKLALCVENLTHLPSANLKRHWNIRLRVRRYKTSSPPRKSSKLGRAAGEVAKFTAQPQNKSHFAASYKVA